MMCVYLINHQTHFLKGIQSHFAAEIYTVVCHQS
jgi:GTP1/Obg family GTP-binding protein